MFRLIFDCILGFSHFEIRVLVWEPPVISEKYMPIAILYNYEQPLAISKPHNFRLCMDTGSFFFLAG